MEMLSDVGQNDLVTFGDSIQHCPIPDLGKGFASTMRTTAHEFALEGFLNTCESIGFVVDPNNDEFKAYPKYVQKWLHKSGWNIYFKKQ